MDRLYLVRHGETEWSLDGRHTGRTDIPLTRRGREQAHQLGAIFPASTFTRIFSSPRLRTRQACEAAGWPADIDPDLAEWDYGRYEGLRTPEIQAQHPGWELFRDGCPEGESPDQITARADRVLARLAAADGTIAVCSHGHFGRALGVRWIGLPLAHGRSFALGEASVSVLAFDRDGRHILESWNATPNR
jgi:probable phosphoglycerate mutase